MTDPSTLPAQSGAVVIGGGVMGCSTVYHLARAGVTDVVLLERNHLTAGTTWHSAAQVRALRSTRNMTALVRYSIGLYAALERETGQQTGWINKGSLSIATTADRLTHIRRQAALARLFDVEATEVSAGAAKEIWPAMNAADVLGAVWSPGDGRVSPSDLCAALVKGAMARGARILEETGVTGIETRGGAIVAVHTNRGTVRTGKVALCTGLWSREAAAMVGVAVPVWPCEHFYLLTRPVAGIAGNLPTLSDHDSHLYIRDDSGGLLVGCFEPMGKPIPPDAIGPDFAFQLLGEDWDHFEPMMINALHRLPALETAEVKMLLNGPESFTPDGSFLLGGATETCGLYLGCGMNSVGVATGGGAGMALAETMVNGHPPFDLHEASPSRFPDCWNSVAALTARVPEVLGKHYEIGYPGRQYQTARDLRHLPLDAIWRDHGARFGQVYGWERPLYFGGPAASVPTFGRPTWFDAVGDEVQAAHTKAALFDQSSLGRIEVRGPNAETFLNRLCTNDMTRAPGAVVFTLLLTGQGGIEADLTVQRLAPETYRLSIGTSAVKRVLGWLRRHVDGATVQIADVTENHAVLALAGPMTARIASDLDASWMNAIGYFRHAAGSLCGIAVRAARLSYVGEAGWEITCDATDARTLCQCLLNAGARPAGLYAQTSMRIEKRFLAYGHDIDTDSNPLSSGYGFAIDWRKDFLGRSALRDARDQLPDRTVATLVFDDDTVNPLGNEPVHAADKIIGMTTSASYGYRVGRPVALSLLKRSHLGTELDVDIAGKRTPVTLHRTPVVDPESLRMRRWSASAVCAPTQAAGHDIRVDTQ